MALKRIGLEHTGLVGAAAGVLKLGRMRGGPTASGGFFFEIVGLGETRRAELTPREAVAVAKLTLEHYGIKVDADPATFRHLDG